MNQNIIHRNFKALIIYYSKFGNTKLVAESLAKGIINSGVVTTCIGIDNFQSINIDEYDLIAIGSPTHNLGAPTEIRNILKEIKRFDVRNKYFFAFDTRNKQLLNNPKWKYFENSASKIIQSYIKRIGGNLIKERSSAIVEGQKGPLVNDALTQFMNIGKEIGFSLAQLKRG